MTEIDLGQASLAELFQLYTGVLDELLARCIVRSTNNPVADYAEHLVVEALGLSCASKSTKGYDATDPEGRKFEIKARRVTKRNKSRMSSAIRDLESRHFDFLAGVLFKEDFSFDKACLVPYEVVVSQAIFRGHVNAHVLMLCDSLWFLDGVVDISKAIRIAIAAEVAARSQASAPARTTSTARSEAAR